MLRTRRTFLLAGTTALVCTLVAGMALGGQTRPVPAPSQAPSAPLPVDLTPVAVGPADPGQVLEVGLALRGRDPEGLAQALAGMSDPTSPTYGQTVSPAMFGDRFGLPAADEDQLVATLEGLGLSVTQRVPQRTSLKVRGTVADLERVLGLELQLFRDPGTGFDYVAAATPPIVPAVFATTVTGIVGVSPRPTIPAQDAASGPPSRGLAPRDLAIVYNFLPLWEQGITGGGQNVAILQFGVDTDADLAVFDQAFGISGPPPERIAVGDGLADAPGGFAIEAALDTQVIRGVAPAAQILVYGFSTNESFATAVDRIVGDGRAQMISVSYGSCEVADSPFAATTAELGRVSFAAAALAGVSIYAASGDWGAFTCHTFDPTDHRQSTFFPSCADNVIGVGGTFLETRADGTYLRETGWQDYLTTSGTGGGISPFAPMPAWQQGPGVQNDRSNGNRQCPDVAAAADSDTGYLMYGTDGDTGVASWYVMGGTSAAAPLWSGIQALMQQAAAAQGVERLGFMAPRYYRIAQDAPGAFHDVTRGGNLVDAATPGWDFATGVGSPDVEKLLPAVLADIAANP